MVRPGTILALVASLAAAGCGNAFELEREEAARAGDDPPREGGACAKIEGGDIGVEGLELAVGAQTIRFHDWVAKAGEPGEFLGFSWNATGPVTLRVKAGGETYPADGGSWTHPQAATDPSASAVSNVEGCDPDAPDDGGGDPDDDDPDGGTPDDPGNGDPDDT